MTDIKMTPFNQQPHSRPVLQMSITGRYLGVYESVSEAARETKLSRTAITNALNKKAGLQFSGGYVWKYVADLA